MHKTAEKACPEMVPNSTRKETDNQNRAPHCFNVSNQNSCLKLGSIEIMKIPYMLKDKHVIFTHYNRSVMDYFYIFHHKIHVPCGLAGQLLISFCSVRNFIFSFNQNI